MDHLLAGCRIDPIIAHRELVGGHRPLEERLLSDRRIRQRLARTEDVAVGVRGSKQAVIAEIGFGRGK